MPDHQSYLSPVRGAVSQHVPASDARNPNASMARQSANGPVSLRRWGPRAFGYMEQVGGALQGLRGVNGLGDVYADITAAIAGGGSVVNDGRGTAYYLDASGNPVAAVNTSNGQVIGGGQVVGGSAASGLDWGMFGIIAVAALVLAELS